MLQTITVPILAALIQSNFSTECCAQGMIRRVFIAAGAVSRRDLLTWHQNTYGI